MSLLFKTIEKSVCSIVIALCVFCAGDLKSAELKSHKAHYTVNLADSAMPSQDVSDVEGEMSLELRQDCEGWTLEQLSDTIIYDNEGGAENIRWGYTIWESNDGNTLRFNSFRKVDGELVENIRGSAKRKVDGTGEISYVQPEVMKLPIEKDVLFPVQYQLSLLKAAEAGERLYVAKVFDGSTTEGAFEMNTFIGGMHKAEQTLGGKDPIQAHIPYWPLKIAVYGKNPEAFGPDYETRQEVFSNGVLKGYTIDYAPDFKIKGTLERLEFLAKQEC
ncbi:DUF1849 domain-containing protein [Candidatus Bealeia paramacronuclearis]|uniref:DUF1849 domain-containing protein n=1 Tax=Candidatus Bealeia paramacronuclearis TaxID=1921001 RepID=A0ABZ2C1F2_9PROT|nr:hypothetical protein [Candidatus Bealeia paramacronuclearis]